mmetsp:Transcript_27402/g.33292  ORF Transcript_27402/g.33292 Transcript_27402/m.33292 type:complete len:80 (+) Transcript_27402:572-811(+)
MYLKDPSPVLFKTWLTKPVKGFNDWSVVRLPASMSSATRHLNIIPFPSIYTACPARCLYEVLECYSVVLHRLMGCGGGS